MGNMLSMSLGILEKYTPKFDLNKSNIGIITAGDSNVFDGIRILYSSIKNKIQFLCYDIGFTKNQQIWAQKNNMAVDSYPVSSALKNIDKWQTFLKPWFIDTSPFEYTIWIDSDCIVIGDLSSAELIQNKQTFFIQHWIKQERLKKNSNNLYKKFPVNSPDLPYVNAGVFGINKLTHQTIITDWKMLLDQGINHNTFPLADIINWDEGALNWALQNNNAFDCIFDDYRYNCFSAFASSVNQHQSSTYHQKVFILEGITTFPQIAFRKILQKKEPYILHYPTRMNNKKKYWTQWQDL